MLRLVHNPTVLDGIEEYHDTENDYLEPAKNYEKPLDIVNDDQHSCSSDEEYSTFERNSTFGFVEKHMIKIIWYEELNSAQSARSEWVSGENGLIERIEKRFGEHWDEKTNTGFDTAICVSLNFYTPMSHTLWPIGYSRFDG